MSAPLRISLITPSFQQASYLEECLASVHHQSYPALEHIVVDGGSTDASKAIVEARTSQLAWWCSEKDSGQSDAINKGLSHATGEVLGWLNSDDALLPNALEIVSRAFEDDPHLLVFGGRIVHRDAHGDHVFAPVNAVSDEVRLFADPVINQPATFYRMSAVRAIGGVDPALRYVMDLELWWQLLFRFGTQHLRFEPVELAMFRLHGESKTVSEHSGFLRETATLLHNLCERTNNTDIASVIAVGYPERPVLRGIPANATEHHGIVRIMAVHFLLKWHAHLHNEMEFDMMQAFQRADATQGVQLFPGMAERWATTRVRVERTSWNRFRLGRKIKHLFR